MQVVGAIHFFTNKGYFSSNVSRRSGTSEEERPRLRCGLDSRKCTPLLGTPVLSALTLCRTGTRWTKACPEQSTVLGPVPLAACTMENSSSRMRRYAYLAPPRHVHVGFQISYVLHDYHCEVLLYRNQFFHLFPLQGSMN